LSAPTDNTNEVESLKKKEAAGDGGRGSVFCRIPLRHCRRPPIDLHVTQRETGHSCDRKPILSDHCGCHDDTHLENKNLFSYQPDKGNIPLLKYGTCDTEITSDAED
jgi:hypothetical protein